MESKVFCEPYENNGIDEQKAHFTVFFYNSVLYY